MASDRQPPSVDQEAALAAREAGRKLFAQACSFVTGAAARDHLPASELAEVAFAGRSNVGKSSLPSGRLIQRDDDFLHTFRRPYMFQNF